MTERFNAPDNYREISVPFENVEIANAAVQAFQTELYELRNKHRIQDLVFVAQVAVKYAEGEGSPTVVGMFGDENKMESLTGFAYGRASAMRQERISRVVEDACSAIRNTSKRK